MFYYTYILQSQKDKKLYIGTTSNLKNRFHLHSIGQVFSTKGRLPLKLIFYEAFLNQKDAIRREKYFKSSPGKRTIKLMLRSFINNNSRMKL